MRAIILAVLVAVGVGFGFMPSVSAAPANGYAIGESATVNNPAVQVHWRGRSRAWRRCHYRGRSWGRCW